MNDNPLLHCFQISKSYQDGCFHNDVLRNISFTLQHGEMIAIIGSSGSGKSTLLHLLGGLDKPTGGDVIFEGQSLNTLSSTAIARLRNRRLGFIYQFHHLLSDFTALENVAMPFLISGNHPAKAQDIAWKMLVAVGIEKRSHHRPAELSGGERQRVAVARALVNHPSLVLADEPTGNLDQRNADSIFELLNEMNMRYGTAFLIVTHDIQLAKRIPRQLKMCNGVLLETR